MRALIKIYFIPIAIIFLLYGCSGVKEKVGLIKKAPDEFQVYENEPLSVPPNFELRPPIEGVIESDEGDNKKIIFSNDDKTDEKLTLSDEILLITAGKKEIKENIRKIINDENHIETLDKSIIDKILDFEPIFELKDNKQTGEIDPVKEKERIEKLQKEGNIIKGNNDAIIMEKEGSLD
jgi:hypothetical protein